ncbi:MAG TPA: ABC transporter ATP-binding protein [Bacillota bacterium]|nr:ABC transporter ATP-binding protein [Bacillota bacterium]
MSGNIVEVKDLRVHFTLKGSLAQDVGGRRKKTVRAVDGVSFYIKQGEILSLVGESGSGKTTTGKAILGLVPFEAEKMLFRGEQINIKDREYKRKFRQSAQMIYQDPYQSLNPRNQVIDIVTEPLVVNKLVESEEDRLELGKKALERAGLTPGEDFFFRYPYELSGGQRQRVVIASSMIMSPSFVVADEPVSMLDASIRTGILKLMMDLRRENDLAYLFITHDLSLAWLISDRIAIMYMGKIMEMGNSKIIISSGRHPYTKALTEIMPKPGIKKEGPRKVLQGETPNPTDVIEGCKFCSRCPIKEEICSREEPPMKEVEPGHFVACHKV